MCFTQRVAPRRSQQSFQQQQQQWIDIVVTTTLKHRASYGYSMRYKQVI